MHAQTRSTLARSIAATALLFNAVSAAYTPAPRWRSSVLDAHASETLQLALTFNMPVTTLTPDMRSTVVALVTNMTQVATAAIRVTSAVAETTATAAALGNQSTLGYTVVRVNVADLAESQVGPVANRLSLQNFNDLLAAENVSALPSAVDASVTVFAQVRPFKNRREVSLLVAACIAIVFLVIIVRSLAISHYQKEMRDKIAANTDVIVDSLSPIHSPHRNPDKDHKYGRLTE